MEPNDFDIVLVVDNTDISMACFETTIDRLGRESHYSITSHHITSHLHEEPSCQKGLGATVRGHECMNTSLLGFSHSMPRFHGLRPHGLKLYLYPHTKWYVAERRTGGLSSTGRPQPLADNPPVLVRRTIPRATGFSSILDSSP
jgi:hypothetical protein